MDGRVIPVVDMIPSLRHIVIRRNKSGCYLNPVSADRSEW